MLVLQDAQVLQRHRSGHRVPGVSKAVVELAALLGEHFGHAVTDQHGAHRQVAAGHAFGHGHEVGL